MSSDSPKTPNPFLRSRDTLEDLMDEVAHWKNRSVEDHGRGIQQACELAAHLLSNREDGRKMLAWEDPREEQLLVGWYGVVKSRGRRA